jgi:hypothetical protein
MDVFPSDIENDLVADDLSVDASWRVASRVRIWAITSSGESLTLNLNRGRIWVMEVSMLLLMTEPQVKGCSEYLGLVLS